MVKAHGSLGPRAYLSILIPRYCHGFDLMMQIPQICTRRFMWLKCDVPMKCNFSAIFLVVGLCNMVIDVDRQQSVFEKRFIKKIQNIARPFIVLAPSLSKT